MAKDPEKYSDKEAKRRFDAMLKSAMKSPPRPMKDIQTTKQKREAAKSKLVKKPGS